MRLILQVRGQKLVKEASLSDAVPAFVREAMQDDQRLGRLKLSAVDGLDSTVTSRTGFSIVLFIGSIIITLVFFSRFLSGTL